MKHEWEKISLMENQIKSRPPPKKPKNKKQTKKQRTFQEVINA